MVNLCIDKGKCCGCGACFAVCPNKAITMKTDEYGFIYPIINEQRCIECGICVKVCNYSRPVLYVPKECFAAVNINNDQLRQSSSGGIFSAIALAFLNEGNIVCGADMMLDKGRASINHIIIDSVDKLHRLQGSKYVHSYTHEIYETVLKLLKHGNDVLFSGTPCQVEAVKSLAGKKYIENLYTIDIICHGIPSQTLFNEYLKYEAEKRGISIEKFYFRDKHNGWGLDGSIVGKDDDGKSITTVINPDNSSYYHLFLKGHIYRKNCYLCPYAQKARAGDISIGDYWGVEKCNPELVGNKSGEFSVESGISCLLVNTNRGKELINKYGKNIRRIKVNFSKIAVRNSQLNHPVELTPMRSKLLKVYKNEGYGGIDKIYKQCKNKEEAYKRLKSIAKIILPDKIVILIKRCINIV